MRIKTWLITIFLISVTAGVGYAQNPQKDTSNSENIGRYQLFQGTYTSFDLRRQQSSTASGVFLLDTVTGRVKRYINKIDEDGKYIETWSPTEISDKK